MLSLLKKIVLVLGGLALIFTAYLYYQALESQVEGGPDARVQDPVADILTIAFGSCNRTSEPQDYWQTIGRHEPDSWLWLGDNIYADTNDPAQMEADYTAQKNQQDYAAFAAAVPSLYGIYDDHDYGKNDAGKEWEIKAEAKSLAADFFDIPTDAPVRQRDGLYQAYDISGAGLTVRLILLDTRYFRDPLTPSTVPGERYTPDPSADVLGEEQWAWLENELRSSTADAHLIVSSIQVIPSEHGWEKWANMPAARERLLALIQSTRPNLPILLSGDRHLGEISRIDRGGYSIFELTSSSLTNATSNPEEVNTHRISPQVGERNYGLLHFTKAPGGGAQVLGELRSLERNDAVAASLALGPDGRPVNKSDLAAVVRPNDAMRTQLDPCPDKPNCVSTQATQKDKQREPIAYTGSGAEALAKLKRLVLDMPRTRLLNEEPNYLHFSFKTWPIPFVDDVEFLLDEEQKVIHYRSASRVGHSDLGVNGKRMAKVVKAWTEG